MENVNLGDDEDVNEGNENNVAVRNETNDNDAGEEFKKITDLTADDIRALEFISEEAAIDFYEKYAQCLGFVSRKDDVYRDPNGNIVSRQLVCNKEGERHSKHVNRDDRVKEAKPITRVMSYLNEVEMKAKIAQNEEKDV